MFVQFCCPHSPRAALSAPVFTLPVLGWLTLGMMRGHSSLTPTPAFNREGGTNFSSPVVQSAYLKVKLPEAG